jgi:NAD(P)-dependent dehydrogenase (short-subunit alcohol dehydrogenase family)
MMGLKAGPTRALHAMAGRSDIRGRGGSNGRSGRARRDRYRGRPGIGASIARLFAAEGAGVVVNDLGGHAYGTGSDEGHAREVADEIIVAGGRAIPDAGAGAAAGEVGLVFTATAADQATATQVAKFANPVLLNAPLPGAAALPSYALLGSPAEIERGQIHEFALCHAVDADTPAELFRTRYSEVPA